MKKCRCATCGEQFESGTLKTKHKKKYLDGSCKLLKGGNENKKMKLFKKQKGKPTTAPVEDEAVEEEEVIEEEDELEEIEEETKAIKKEIEEVKAKRKPPVEEPVEEELTEEKVKQILINFEQRLQKIEYNLRLIP